MPMEKVLVDMMLRPKIIKYIYDRFNQFLLEYLTYYLNAAKNKVHILRLSADFGTQSGLLMSRSMFREWFFQPLKKCCDIIHQKGVKTMFHSCGSIRELIPDFIAAGIDILNPIQTSAKNMDIAELKREFGSDICFHGAIDEQHILKKTVQEVQDEVKRVIEILAPGGGYILAPTHYLSKDIPWKNVVAMYEAARKFGDY